MLLVAASIACGWIGWSGEVLFLPIAMIFPALWAHSQSRMVACLVSAGYFLAASRGLPQGVASFYAADIWPGLLLWLAASTSFVSVHAALWPRRRDDGLPGRKGRDGAGACAISWLRCSWDCRPSALPVGRIGLPQPASSS